MGDLAVLQGAGSLAPPWVLPGLRLAFRGLSGPFWHLLAGAGRGEVPFILSASSRQKTDEREAADLIFYATRGLGRGYGGLLVIPPETCLLPMVSDGLGRLLRPRAGAVRGRVSLWQEEVLVLAKCNPEVGLEEVLGPAVCTHLPASLLLPFLAPLRSLRLQCSPVVLPLQAPAPRNVSYALLGPSSH